MTLPDNTVQVTFTGTPVAPNARPLTGVVILTLLTSVTGDADVIPTVVRARLVNGTWSTALLTTTDDSTYPNGWTYQVDQLIDGMPYVSETYYLSHTDAVDGVINIDTLTPITAPDGRSPYATRADLDALSSRLSATFVQYSLATVWGPMPHNLGYIPSITIIDSTNEVIEGFTIVSIDANNATVSFNPAISGRALFS